MGCLCCREVDAMPIALAKMPEREVSISPFNFYGHQSDVLALYLSTYYMSSFFFFFLFLV